MEANEAKKRTTSPGPATFANPTLSSLTKSKDPAGVRQKLSKIDLAMFKLGKDIQIDYQKKQQLEKKSQKTSEKLLNQIKSLKLAFEQLSDSVVQETTKIQTDFTKELQQSREDADKQFNNLNQDLQNHVDQKSTNNERIHTVLKELSQHIQNLFDKDKQISMDLERNETTILKNNEQNQSQIQQYQLFHKEQLKKQKLLQKENEKKDFNLGKQENFENQNESDIQQLKNKLQLLSEAVKINSVENANRIHGLQVTNEVLNKTNYSLLDRIDQFNSETYQQLKAMQLDIMRVLDRVQNQSSQFTNEQTVSDQNNIDTVLIYLQRDLANLIERIHIIEEFQNRQRVDIIEGIQDLEFKWNKEIGIIEDQFYVISRKKLFKY